VASHPAKSLPVLGDIQLEASARHSKHPILVSALESDQSVKA
jgi:hypothetical protein